LVKSGSGIVILNAANSYNGPTTVGAGTLEVGASGALPTASAVTVSNGATLRFLKNSGVINLTNLTVSSGGTLEQNLVTITSLGAVNLMGSTLKVNGTPTLTSYTLITGTTSLTGTPTLSPAISGYSLSLSGNSLLLIAAPSNLSYSNINGTVDEAITSVNPAVTGTPTSYSISPALPAGLSFSTTTGVISGTPTATATSATYTVTASNAAGSTFATLTIVVVPAASSGPTIEQAYEGKDPLAVNPDNGLTYLMNYAFGGSDTTAPILPVLDTSDATKLTLVAYVRTASDIQSVVGETASTLPSFDSVNTIPGEVIDPSDAPTGMEKRKYSVMVSGDRKFLRLKVTKR